MNPRGAGFGAGGSLYVADSSNSRLQNFGQFGKSFDGTMGARGKGPGDFGTPTDVECLDSVEDLLVASEGMAVTSGLRPDLITVDASHHRLQIFEEGRDPLVCGHRGDGIGELNFPVSVSWHDGWTVDADCPPLEVDAPSWFVGSSTRRDCELRLEGGEVGEFLVRETPIRDVLSLCFISPES